MPKKPQLGRKFNAFDVTSLVVGSIVGADIYVAAAFGARLVGPASILVWLVAGIAATTIAQEGATGGKDSLSLSGSTSTQRI